MRRRRIPFWRHFDSGGKGHFHLPGFVGEAIQTLDYNQGINIHRWAFFNPFLRQKLSRIHQGLGEPGYPSIF
jgi:hypothetical protein